MNTFYKTSYPKQGKFSHNPDKTSIVSKNINSKLRTNADKKYEMMEEKRNPTKLHNVIENKI